MIFDVSDPIRCFIRGGCPLAVEMPRFGLVFSGWRAQPAGSTFELKFPVRSSGRHLKAKLDPSEAGLEIRYSFSLILLAEAHSPQGSPLQQQDLQSFALIEPFLQSFLTEIPSRDAELSPNLRAV